ncbi:glycosyl hydrolase [Cellulomonas sp. APG4]|uniref:glycosyl hydrolase n=1 Tax=Cellulomonas sp. APG4 TaxID=1538656 RepID=UPI001ED8C050|nr:glycosyl hydrolase [Cellulomonas sp. APG4]
MRTSRDLSRRPVRATLVTAVLAVLTTALGAGVATAQPAVRTAAEDEQRMLLGATPQGGGDSRRDGVEELEATIGRELDYVRVFEQWNSAYPTAYHSWLTASDRIMLLSVRAKRTNGTNIPWRDIATMAPGSTLHTELHRWISRVEAVDGEVWFTFHHEPEIQASIPNGTDADYVAAWRRVVDEFRARGVDNVRFVWIVTGYGFEVAPSDRRYAPKWYPGDAWVDVMGSDTYNWSSCREGVYNPWRPFSNVPAGLRAFGELHPDEDLLITEWASAEQGGDKAAWIDEARTVMKRADHAQFIGLSYFNKIDGTFPQCRWPIDSSPAAEAAFVRLAQDPFFGGPGTGGPPPDPDPEPVVVLVTADPAALPAPEAAVRARLEGLGMDVRLVDDHQVTAATAADADMVVVTHSVTRTQVGTALRDVAATVWMAKPYLFDEMAMTGPTPTTDYGSLATQTVTVSTAGHPMLAGRTGTVPFLAPRDAVAYGVPGPAATRAAVVGTRPVLFAYRPGEARVDGTPAPGCRVAFPLFGTAPTRLTSDGWAMFDATATWAAAGC